MELQVLSIFVLPVIFSVVSGKHSVKTREIKYNNTMILQSGPRHKTLINLNSQRSYKPNDLLAVYNDKHCKPCLSCMERAIKARIAALKNEPKPDSVELHNAIITSVVGETKIREKRSPNNEEPKEKKSKPKKSKSIAVTRYTLNGHAHVLKVKETTLDDLHTTCDVYSVTKSYPCQSAEGTSLIASVKKSKSKSKRDKTQTSTRKSTSAGGHRKRDTSNLSFDNTQIPENVMPSFEEYY